MEVASGLNQDGFIHGRTAHLHDVENVERADDDTDDSDDDSDDDGNFHEKDLIDDDDEDEDADASGDDDVCREGEE